MKILKWIVFFIVIISFALILIPFLFKPKLIDLAKQEIDNNLNARVEFGDFGLQLFSSFPDLTFKIEDFNIIGKGEFNNDTLVRFEAMMLNVDLLSVLGDKIAINSVVLKKPVILAKALKGGKVNWDITIPSEETELKSENDNIDEISFALALKHFEIIDGTVIYDDQDLEVYTFLNDLDFVLSGDMTSDEAILNIYGTVNEFSMIYEGIKYLNKTHLKLEAGIDADLANFKYTFRENIFHINDLELGIDGAISMPEDDINVDLIFEAKRNEFKHFLSLVPVIFMSDFETVQCDGNLALKGKIKGVYNESSLPGYFVQLKVDDASFKYPDLPGSAENIAVDLEVNNPDGIDDHMVVDLKKFHIDFEKNPLDASLKIKTPISDPNLKGHIRANLDLAKLKSIIPLDGIIMNGLIYSDLLFEGKMSSIEQEKYENFKAIGNVLIQEMNYESADLPKGMNISKAEMNFTPQYLNLKAFDSKIGESDIQMKGKIENYMAYALKDDVLKGEFILNSSLLNVNEFMPDEEGTSSSESSQNEGDSELTVFEIPSNIDFKLQSEIGKVLYDNLEIENLDGTIWIKDSKLSMNDVKMDMMDGTITMNGAYDAKDISSPVINFDFGINNFNLSKTFEAFNTIKQLVPIAEKCSGDFSATIANYSCVLDKNMIPILSSINSNGKILTQEILLQNADVFNKIGSELKMDKFNQFNLNDVDLSFELKDGNLFVKPFDVKMGGTKATIGGKQGIDQSLAYTMTFEIPRSQFGGAANTVLDNLVSSAKTKGVDVKLGANINVNALIGGTLSNPTIKLDLKEQGQNIGKDIKNEVINIVNEKVDNAKAEAIKKAKKQADQLLSEANKKGEQLISAAQKTANEIKKVAKDNADKIRAEGKTQGDKLIKEAGSNIIKKKLAEKGAKELNNQAIIRANQLEAEADNKAKLTVDKARTEANNINQKAKVEADKLIAKAEGM
ncbi:MAG: AsmA family protein [Bacteroidales bacterium]|nr:AsmA family protein [Bacteroidales bacterium]